MWARVAGAITLSPGGFSRGDLLADFQTTYGAQLIGATLVRVRGIMACQTSAATTDFQGVRWAAAVEQNPGAAAMAAGDGPFTGDHKDWMVFEPFAVAGAGQIGVNQDPAGRVIDVKSMRRIEELNEEFFYAAEADAGNTAAVTLYFDLSIGIKLP